MHSPHKDHAVAEHAALQEPQRRSAALTSPCLHSMQLLFNAIFALWQEAQQHNQLCISNVRPYQVEISKIPQLGSGHNPSCIYCLAEAIGT